MGAAAHHADPIVGLDIERVRQDFPALQQKVYDRPLTYLDSAATSLKPKAVIEAVEKVYAEDCANIHRGVHALSQRATESYEGARQRIRDFIGAGSEREIIFTRGTTEAINLVAQSYGRSNFGPGDEVLITEMEHHSNIVPWQLLCEQVGCGLQVVPMDDDGVLDMDAFGRLLSKKTKLIAVSHVSNALGTINPIEAIIHQGHAHGAVVLIDGAQAAPHLHIDVQALDCDFYALSSHKMYGPTGIGVLYGKEALLEAMPPYQGGGDMILTVSFDKTTYNKLPHKFEAGTPNIAGTIGLGAAVDYIEGLGKSAIAAHEDDVLRYGTDVLTQIKGLRLLGTAQQKTGVLSFTLEGIHPHDIGTILDQEGIAIRAGHHCAQPVMQHFGIPASARASLGVYNSRQDIDRLAAGIEQVIALLGRQ